MDDDKSLINVDAKASLVNVDLGGSIEIKADCTDFINNATPRGISWVARLLGGRKSADTERYIRLLKARTDVDVKGILEGKLVFDPKEETLIPTSQVFKQQIVGAIQDEEIQNLIACSIKAAENIKEGATEKEPSQDFINRWRNEAKQIHSEELQKIWGLLMAEEISSPDSISLRTLSLVSQISKKEAEIFINCLEYIIDGKYLIEADTLIDRDTKRTLRNAGILIAYTPNNFGHRHWFEKNIKLTSLDKEDRKVFYINTLNYSFCIDQSDITQNPIYQDNRPKFTHWELSHEAQELYSILYLQKRGVCEKEAKGIISAFLLDDLKNQITGIYFGYIEDDGQVTNFKKYPL